MSNIQTFDELVDWANNFSSQNQSYEVPLIILIPIALLIFCGVVYLFYQFPTARPQVIPTTDVDDDSDDLESSKDVDDQDDHCSRQHLW